MRPVALALLLAPLAGCDLQEIFSPTPASTCDISFDAIDGTNWARLDGGTQDLQARMRFEVEDGEIKALYTVNSISDVYSYDCTLRGTEERPELMCKEPPIADAWCLSLEAHEEGYCTAERLREFGADSLSDEELEEQIEAVRKVVEQNKEAGQWEQLAAMNNNPNNKLQGVFYATINERRCNLTVTDMYMTIHNGQRREESNPVGTSPFSRADDDLQFAHCNAQILDWAEPEAPPLEEVPQARQHDFGSLVHYHYLGENAVEAEEGCAYSMDTYAGWRSVQRNIAVEAADEGALRWTTSHTWSDPQALTSVSDRQLGIFAMVRYKQCEGGEREKIDGLCSATFLEGVAAADAE